MTTSDYCGSTDTVTGRPCRRRAGAGRTSCLLHTRTPQLPVVADLGRPTGLGPGGTALWKAVTADHELDALQEVTLAEACRAKDRLDELDSVIHGKGVLHLMQFRVLGSHTSSDEQHLTVDVKFDNVISTANQTANQMKQLLAALRLPDEVSGKRPQQRGGGRGAYAPGAPSTAGAGGSVSSLDRARAAKSS